MGKEEWLYAEISIIQKESKYTKYKNICDNKVMFKLLFLLLPLLFFAFNLSAIESNTTYKQIHFKNDGVTWKCKTCNKSNWSNKTDWTGRYSCSCGTYKN